MDRQANMSFLHMYLKVFTIFFSSIIKSRYNKTLCYEVCHVHRLILSTSIFTKPESGTDKEGYSAIIEG